MRAQGEKTFADPGPAGHPVLPEVQGRSQFRPALRRARLVHAAMQIETLISVSMTVLATTFLWLNEQFLPGWNWAPALALILGAGSSAVLIGIAMRDPDLADPAIAMALECQLHVEDFKNAHIRHQLGLVVVHRTNIESLSIRSGRKRQSVIAGNLTAIDAWLDGIRRLSAMLEPIEEKSSALSAQALDLRKRVDELEARTRTAVCRTTRAQLLETLAGRKMQLRAIEELESVAERGLLRLEQAVSALGTMDTKLTIAVAGAQDELMVTDIRDGIKREIDEIDLVIAAMKRVYAAAH